MGPGRVNLHSGLGGRGTPTSHHLRAHSHPSSNRVRCVCTCHEKKERKKLISGRYLGDILRLVICELSDEGVLFLGQNTVQARKTVCAGHGVSLAHGERPNRGTVDGHRYLQSCLALKTTLAERQFFRALAKFIGRRAARLSACGIVAILNKMGYLELGYSIGGVF
jgi:hexokinase